MATINEARREVRRVFGAATVEAETDDGAEVRILVEGWPDRIVYRTDRLVEALRRFPDGHGATEEGDRDVCQATEEAGAFVSVA
jgi:hypothetical protein